MWHLLLIAVSSLKSKIENGLVSRAEDDPRVFTASVGFCRAEKSVSEVQDATANLWEEGRAEDELSPEEIQMVCPHCVYLRVIICANCVSHESMAEYGWPLRANLISPKQTQTQSFIRLLLVILPFPLCGGFNVWLCVGV